MRLSSRRNPKRPIAAVGVVVWRGERFILVRRGREPRRGQWSIPGGAQQLGETVYAAARREVLEETGLEVEIRGLVDVVDSIARDEAGNLEYHYTLVDLCAESARGEPRAGDDAEAVGWFTLEELPGLELWSETERIIRETALLRNQGSRASSRSGP
jgi:8-oxo-dGTP diphosphatase